MNLADIIASLEAAQNETRGANEARYNDILNELRNQRTRGMGQLDETRGLLGDRVTHVGDLLNSSGTTAKREARKNFQEGSARGLQDLISQGLSGSTVLSAMQRRNQEDYGNQLETIRENTDRAQAGAYLSTTGDLANFMLNRVGIERGLTGDITGVMERRTDAYPDTGPYADLIRQLMQGTAAGGGGRSNSVVGGHPSGTIGGPGFGGSVGGGGGGGGGSGSGGSYGSNVRTFTNESSGSNVRGFGDPLNPISGTNMMSSYGSMIGQGSNIYLGGRALGPDGTLQGVGTTPGGPQFTNNGMISVSDGTTRRTMAQGMAPPGYEGLQDDPGTNQYEDLITSANQAGNSSASSNSGSGGGGGSGEEFQLAGSNGMGGAIFDQYRMVATRPGWARWRPGYGP